MPQSLRTYLGTLRAESPEAFLQVDKTVSPKHGISAILEKVRREKKGAAVHFPSVEGSPVPVVGNVMTNRDRVCLALGLAPESKDYGEIMRDRLDRILPPVQVQTGPVHEVKRTGDEVDLADLPILTHAESDAAAEPSHGRGCGPKSAIRRGDGEPPTDRPARRPAFGESSRPKILHWPLASKLRAIKERFWKRPL